MQKPYLPKELFIMLTKTEINTETEQLPAFFVLVSSVSDITEETRDSVSVGVSVLILCVDWGWIIPT